MSVRIVTNSLQSGDWVKVFIGDDLIQQGHTISLQDIVFILNKLSIEAGITNLTDLELDEYDGR